MAVRLAVNTLNRSCNSIATTPDVGGTTNATGSLLIYTGSQPATPATAATGTLLVTIHFNNPSFVAASNGVASLIVSPSLSGTVTNTGTAGWFRVLDRGGNPVFDGSVGTSGADMNMDNINFVAGGFVVLSSTTITGTM